MGKIIIGIVVLIAAASAYWYFFMNDTPTSEPQQQQTSNATSTDHVQGQELVVGTGREAAPGTQVTIDYVGQLEDGTVFDSSESHGSPLTFVLGAQGIIPGFQIGVNGMKEGGERAVLIPPALAYGDQAVGVIPANSNLIFKIKLVKVEDAPAAPQGE